MILQKLKQAFPQEILESHDDRGDETLVIRKDKLHPLLALLKNDAALAFDFLMDLCGVDYLSERPRFEVVYHFYSSIHNHRLCLRVKVAEEGLNLPTATDLWPAADWFEREAAEMFGFRFEGHPNPKKLFLFDEFEGYPLRKDYPITKRQRIPIPSEVP